MRIALWNASGLDNLGDRLLDEVTRRELRRRVGATFQTFSPWPSPGMEMLWIDSEGRWPGEGQFDGIVIGGGALLMGPPFIHWSQQQFYLGPFPERFRDDCPVLWNAVCAGSQFMTSFAQPWRAYVQAAAARLQHRSVRNGRTADFLSSCGVEEIVSVVPDPVVLLREPAIRSSRRAVRPRVGLAVGTSGYSADFVSRLALPANAERGDENPLVCLAPDPEKLREFGAPHQCTAGELAARFRMILSPSRYDVEVCSFGALYSDDDAAQVLASELGAGAPRSFSGAAGESALDWIASLDCLVASRLHACILALVAGTPVFALDPYYNSIIETSKLHALMFDAGLGDFYTTLETFLTGGDQLASGIDAALTHPQSFAATHADMHARAARHFDDIAGVLRAGQKAARTPNRSDPSLSAGAPRDRA